MFFEIAIHLEKQGTEGAGSTNCLVVLSPTVGAISSSVDSVQTESPRALL